MQRQKSEYNILTVSNALRILDLLAAEGELGVTELARRLGLHKNNAFRLLATLEQNGFVEQAAERRYRLGLRCLELGHAYERLNPLLQRVAPVLEELVQGSGEAAQLGVLDRFEVVHTALGRSSRVLAANLPLGTRLPCHSTALGKALLGCSPAPVREAYDKAVVAHGALERRTPATITDREKLFEHLRTVGAQGWALEEEECEPGLACAAAPVFNGAGDLVGALAVAGPVTRLDRDRLEGQIVPLLLRGAERLSRELGHRG